MEKTTGGGSPGRRLSFRARLLIAMLIVTLFMAVYLSAFSSNLSSRTIDEMSRRLSESGIQATHTMLNRSFSSAQDILTMIVRLPEVQELIALRSLSQAELERYREQLDTAVLQQTYYTGAEDISFKSINIFFENGLNYLEPADNRFPFHDFQSCLDYFAERGYIKSEGYSPMAWAGSIRVRDRTNREVDCIMGVRMLYEAGSLTKRGIMVYAIEEAPIYKRYEPLSENAVILHYDGTVVSANDKRLLGQPLQNEQLREAVLNSRKASGSTVYKQDGVPMMASFKKVANNDMFLVVPFDYYSQIEKSELLSFLWSTLAISLSGVIIAAIFAAWLTKSLSSSILALKQGVQQVYEGDMSVRFGEVNIPEISYLGSKINDMLDQISESFEIRKKDEMAKRDLELHLMQSQINPHLLYNTLDGALWALEDERGEQAKQILSALSDFYRKTLSGGSMLVPLSSELEMVDHYISIQRLARDMNITFETDVPEELLSFSVIKMTLQPIVENSILHGLSAYRDDGKITISARAGEGRLQLRLTDNGLGMLPEELEKISRDMNTYPPSRALGHFGLYNIHQRIRNHFGEPYGISVESELSAYTSVTIEMPCPEPPRGKTEGNGSHV